MTPIFSPFTSVFLFHPSLPRSLSPRCLSAKSQERGADSPGRTEEEGGRVEEERSGREGERSAEEAVREGEAGSGGGGRCADSLS